MNKKLLCAALVALAALAAVPGIASADTDPAQWDVYTQAGNVRDHRTFMPDTSYFIRSTTVGRLVGGNDRDDFAKLGVGTQWRFVRENGRDHRTLRNGETIAIYNAGYDGYITDGGTVSGRAIARFSRTPKYVWTVERKPGNGMSLYVKTTGSERKYLVADTSSGKPELHWYRTGTPTPQPPTCSSGFTPGSLHRDVSIAAAQPAVDGYPTYKATLGTGQCGYLNQVINNSNQTIGIVKKGHTTAECGDPAAVVYLGVYDSTGPGALGLGNVTPALPVDIGICGYGDPGASLRMVYEWYAR
jgi:hypothetical protein